MRSSEVLLVARYGWGLRMLTVGYLVIGSLLYPSIPEFWRQGRWWYMLATALFSVIAIGSTLDLFVRRTLVSCEGIEQRSLLGRTTFVSWKKVEKFVIEGRERLIVTYDKNQQLRIYLMEAEPDDILEIAKKYADPNTRVITI